MAEEGAMNMNIDRIKLGTVIEAFFQHGKA